MEAMALGLPVIATDCPCGGPRTIISHQENGFLIPIMDQNALENAMRFFIKNPTIVEEYGKNARNIGEIANANAIYEQWKDYMETICNG